MRKFLSIIALVVLTIGLIVGGIMLFTNLPNNEFTKETINSGNALQIGGGIAMILGGVCSGIMAIANFFKMKVKDND